MKIALGADHAGFHLKQELLGKLRRDGHDVTDLGADSTASTDYPDYAGKVGHAVISGAAERGVLVCSSGVGMSIAANKINGIRAALAVNPDEVSFSRKHNDANIIAFGERYTTAPMAEAMLDTFLNTPFEGGRHQRRISKIEALEQENHK